MSAQGFPTLADLFAPIKKHNMAEMNVPERASNGKRHAQKRTTRVDLTAMVDLGFLLITFFMLASVFQKPKAMEVNKPVPAKTQGY